MDGFVDSPQWSSGALRSSNESLVIDPPSLAGTSLFSSYLSLSSSYKILYQVTNFKRLPA